MDTQITVSVILPFGKIFDSSILNMLSSKKHVELIYSSSTGYSNKKIENTTIVHLLYKKEMDYLNNAVIVAGGKYVSLIFDDDIESIAKIIKISEGDYRADIIAGDSSKGFLKRLGIRNVSKTYPLVFDRDYLATTLPFVAKIDPTYFVNKVRDANKNSRLFLSPNYISTKKYFNKSFYMIRPYHRLFIRKIFTFTKKVNKEIYKIENEIDRNTLQRIKYTKDIPVFINCRDRYTPLLKLVNWIEDEGLTNIIFIDNHSSYKPLLDYYKNTKYTVLHLGQNIGHRAPWISGALNVYAKDLPFIITDPDILPLESSHGATNKFIELLNKHNDYCKVGFGLRKDNLPDSYELKETVVKWESQFWKNTLEKNVYIADLDTTFALYRPNTKYKIRPALRTGGKFIAEHEPWYINSKNPSSEVLYYRKHANKSVGSWGLKKSDTADFYKKPNAKIVN